MQYQAVAEGPGGLRVLLSKLLGVELKITTAAQLRQHRPDGRAQGRDRVDVLRKASGASLVPVRMGRGFEGLRIQTVENFGARAIEVKAGDDHGLLRPRVPRVLDRQVVDSALHLEPAVVKTTVSVTDESHARSRGDALLGEQDVSDGRDQVRSAVERIVEVEE